MLCRVIIKAVKMSIRVFTKAETFKFFEITLFEPIFDVILVFVVVIQRKVNSTLF